MMTKPQWAILRNKCVAGSITFQEKAQKVTLFGNRIFTDVTSYTELV
jgi:hypothetical protein